MYTDTQDHYAFAQKYMTPGEYVLWRGHPEKGNTFTAASAIRALFSLGVLAFCLVWEITAFRQGNSVIMMVFGLPFIAVGLFMLWSSTLRGPYLRNKTFYVITNKKLMLKEGKNIRFCDGHRLPPMQVKEHRNGNATLSFSYDLFPSTVTRRTSAGFALENLADAGGAQRALEAMQEFAKQNPEPEDDSPEW